MPKSADEMTASLTINLEKETEKSLGGWLRLAYEEA
jgi:hypothetical protein